MKTRFKNKATTIFGLMFWSLMFAIAIKAFIKDELTLSIILGQLTPLAFIGWVFVMAKNSLLNGITGGLFKKMGWIKEE